MHLIAISNANYLQIELIFVCFGLTTSNNQLPCIAKKTIFAKFARGMGRLINHINIRFTQDFNPDGKN